MLDVLTGSAHWIEIQPSELGECKPRQVQAKVFSSIKPEQIAVRVPSLRMLFQNRPNTFPYCQLADNCLSVRIIVKFEGTFSPGFVQCVHVLTVQSTRFGRTCWFSRRIAPYTVSLLRTKSSPCICVSAHKNMA